MKAEEKVVWIINQYASTPETGMGGRHYYLARSLAKQGCTVFLIASSFGHKMRRPPCVTDRFTVSEQDGFNMVWIKMPKYSGSGSPVRILNWFLFSFMLRFLPGFLKSKPDVVYYSSPSLIGYLGAERLARTTAARLFFEIRDIWPLTLQKLGGYTNNNPLIRFMSWVEKRAYKSADVLLSNLKGADRHIKQVAGNCDQFFWVPNGIFLDEVSNPDPLPDGDITKIRTSRFVVGYAGATRMGANGRKAVLEKYNWDNEQAGLIALYEGVAGA